MDEKEKKELIKKADYIARLLQHLLSVELYLGGVSQEQIGKHIGISKGSVNKMLKGVKRD